MSRLGMTGAMGVIYTRETPKQKALRNWKNMVNSTDTFMVLVNFKRGGEIIYEGRSIRNVEWIKSKSTFYFQEDAYNALKKIHKKCKEQCSANPVDKQVSELKKGSFFFIKRFAGVVYEYEFYIKHNYPKGIKKRKDYKNWKGSKKWTTYKHVKK